MSRSASRSASSARRPAAATALALGLAAVALGTSACTLASPKTIATPYAASDGVNVELPIGTRTSVKLRNLLFVSAGKGRPGVLVGAATTDGGNPVDVELAVVDPASGQSALAQASLTTAPGELTQIGPAGTVRVRVEEMPVLPGAVLTVRVQGPSGGRQFPVPVLAPTAQYASLSPTPAPPSESPSESASPSGSGSPTSSAGPTASGGTAASGSPTATRTATRTATPTSSSKG